MQYEAGTISGVGYKDGTEIMRKEIKTAGEPAAIVLSPDRSEISADGSDLSFITVTVVDKDNIPVPHADNLVNSRLRAQAPLPVLTTAARQAWSLSRLTTGRHLTVNAWLS